VVKPPANKELCGMVLLESMAKDASFRHTISRMKFMEYLEY
jgi:hypothetical protein